MIEVRNLTKRYGTHTAVDNLSFKIEKGEICGFLGPNGAGKSTTMNIITGCLGATEDELRSWKLDEASAAVLLIYGENEENTKILFGITNENGDHYARLSDSEMVYTVDSQALDSLMNADMSVMYDKAVLKSDFENIIYAYAVSEKGEYVISDSAKPGEAQENLWEKLSDIKAHEKTDAEGEYVTLLKVYAKNADGIEITAEFSEYSYEYYILIVNGETKYLVDADPVDQIIRYANSMIAY